MSELFVGSLVSFTSLSTVEDRTSGSCGSEVPRP